MPCPARLCRRRQRHVRPSTCTIGSFARSAASPRRMICAYAAACLPLSSLPATAGRHDPIAPGRDWRRHVFLLVLIVEALGHPYLPSCPFCTYIRNHSASAGPDLRLCELVRRLGAHNFIYPSTYILIHLQNCKAQPHKYPVGCITDSTPRGPRSRSCLPPALEPIPLTYGPYTLDLGPCR
jgi:hypothetical protein